MQPTAVGSSFDVQTTVQTPTTVDVQVSLSSKKRASDAQSLHPTYLLCMVSVLIKQSVDGSLL